MAQSVPDQWRFSIDTPQGSHRDLAWREAISAAQELAVGSLCADRQGESMNLEFNATHAALLYARRLEPTLRPYFPNRAPELQDVRPFFCGSCSVFLGSKDEYLSRFLDRESGFRLFVAALHGPPLPTMLPETEGWQPLLPGFDGVAPELQLDWRPLISTEQANRQPEGNTRAR
jgi:hypothetical protein